MSKAPSRRAQAVSASMPAAITSAPMPSPGMAATRYRRMMHDPMTERELFSSGPDRRGHARQVRDARQHLLGKQRHAAHRALMIEETRLLHHQKVIEAADALVEALDLGHD